MIYFQEDTEYLVLWRDFSRYDATYEPEGNVTKASSGTIVLIL